MTLNEPQKIFPGATEGTWHQHGNGGGWVQNTCTVETSVYVGPNAQVSGNARVYGNAQVSGDAWKFSPLYIQGTRHAVTVSAYGMIQVGCHSHPVGWWQEHYRATGKTEGYTKTEVDEYGLYIALAAAWIKLHGVDKVTKVTA